MSPRVLIWLNGLVLLGGVLAAGAVSPDATPAPVTALAAPSPSPTAEPVVQNRPAAPAEAAPSPSPSPAPPSPAATRSPAPSPLPPPPPRPRVVAETDWAPYAVAGPVVLHAPVDRVEFVGFHQSSHDGAQPMSPVKGPVRAFLLDDRGRDTSRQGATDVVVDPTREVRSPVTGTVLRAGSYTLYCDHSDDYVVVEPDARPGWEVKVLHFRGLRVAAGQRVEAGVTVLGSGGRVLPFQSQVDKISAPPHWPHLHIEVVDPSVPDRKTGGGCP